MPQNRKNINNLTPKPQKILLPKTWSSSHQTQPSNSITIHQSWSNLPVGAAKFWLLLPSCCNCQFSLFTTNNLTPLIRTSRLLYHACSVGSRTQSLLQKLILIELSGTVKGLWRGVHLTALLPVKLVTQKQNLLHKTDTGCCSRISLQQQNWKALSPTLLLSKALAMSLWTG